MSESETQPNEPVGELQELRYVPHLRGARLSPVVANGNLANPTPTANQACRNLEHVLEAFALTRCRKRRAPETT